MVMRAGSKEKGRRVVHKAGGKVGRQGWYSRQ